LQKAMQLFQAWQIALLDCFHRLLKHDRIVNKAFGFHVVPGGFPGQFEAVFEALDHPFFL